MLRRTVVPVLALLLMAAPAAAQQADAAARAARLVAEPASLTMVVGGEAALRVTAVDTDGRAVDAPIRIAAPRTALRVDDGVVTAREAGSHEIVATLVLPPGSAREPLTLRIPVTVEHPPIARVEIETADGRLYQGTTLSHAATALHADGTERVGADIRWSSSDPAVATVDPFGNVTAVGSGSVEITAAAGDASARVTHRVAPLHATRLEISGGADAVRTGDVQAFSVRAVADDGSVIDDVPVTWAHTYSPAPGELGTSAHGQLLDGRFVADVPGVYTVLASAGPLTARKSFRVTERDAVRKLRVIGQGQSSRVRTTDLWPFEGVDGRDYALTGAKLSDGFAFVWDITDPANIFKTDSVQVDARTINDVKVSPDGRYGVLTREGASDRRNGVIILDLSTPAHPTVASIFDQELTGGVHNAYATNDYLFAVSGGDKYVIMDMRDIANPKYVSEYNHPDSRIHDVWVHDGIAYSAEWGTGIVIVDVGNGRWGGTIESPKLVTTYRLPSDGTHAVFPYRQTDTGKFYLFVGDEIMSRRGMAMEGPPGSWAEKYDGGSYAERYDPATGAGGVPLATTGYIQIVDFTDPDNIEMVARYEVTEYGTHNIWVEDDMLFQAYYEGGLRVVDVSGELMGNLYTQGREIAAFKPFDPQGFVANSPMVWSAIPFKGHVFFSDTNSGLWAVKIEPRERAVM